MANEENNNYDNTTNQNKQQYQQSSSQRSYSSRTDADYPECNLVKMTEKKCWINENNKRECRIMEDLTRQCPGKPPEVLESNHDSSEEPVISWKESLPWRITSWPRPFSGWWSPSKTFDLDEDTNQDTDDLFGDIQSHINRSMDEMKRIESSFMNSLDNIFSRFRVPKEERPKDEFMEKEWDQFHKRWRNSSDKEDNDEF
eukprot:gb/GECH01003368.1/.p1 GENE.gb/GECH01003368.1/~~gb/GECH01003368.1/.p1  ORF type:complete len:200 (+),score=67.18 gb/GECH01003368.1/:1-600(+)